MFTLVRLTLKTISSGRKGIPRPTASSGPRPQYSVARSQPSTDMFATSLLVGKPSGKVLSVPFWPWRAIESMAGVAATCKGVLP